MWINTKEAKELWGFSSETLRRYRKNKVLTRGKDYKYLDAHRRLHIDYKLVYNTDTVQDSITEFHTKDFIEKLKIKPNKEVQAAIQHFIDRYA
tara:strand:+ start:127 stop:405 length:279 start_codon:yes stop_codon:yes gene_type:complete